MNLNGTHIALNWDGQRIALEYQWLRPEGVAATSPLVVFLHEGLGSVAMWKDFPQRLFEVLQCRGLLMSRPGYGQSTPVAEGTRWEPDFLERQATEVLPAALETLGVDAHAQPVWLLGHSDGASIALIYASANPGLVAGVVTLAPHCFVEDCTVDSIAALQAPAVRGPLIQRLARYHQAPEAVFQAWSRIWLDGAFRAWSIADRIPRIRCPVLAVQGLDDEYGTLEQIHSIARALPGARLLELEACGHSPQRDQPQAVIEAINSLMNTH